MTLQTNPAERREMVQAISERLGSPAVYLRTPTYAYRIGGLTVERDGSIISDDDALLEALRPMLIERGWLTDAEASVTKTEPTEQDSEITQMELSFPVEDWTVPQLKNFLHTLYLNPKKLLDSVRLLCRGQNKPVPVLCNAFIVVPQFL